MGSRRGYQEARHQMRQRQDCAKRSDLETTYRATAAPSLQRRGQSTRRGHQLNRLLGQASRRWWYRQQRGRSTCSQAETSLSQPEDANRRRIWTSQPAEICPPSCQAAQQLCRCSYLSLRYSWLREEVLWHTIILYRFLRLHARWLCEALSIYRFSASAVSLTC